MLEVSLSPFPAGESQTWFAALMFPTKCSLQPSAACSLGLRSGCFTWPHSHCSSQLVEEFSIHFPTPPSVFRWIPVVCHEPPRVRQALHHLPGAPAVPGHPGGGPWRPAAQRPDRFRAGGQRVGQEGRLKPLRWDQRWGSPQPRGRLLIGPHDDFYYFYLYFSWWISSQLPQHSHAEFCAASFLDFSAL